jgi:hypothetical protein
MIYISTLSFLFILLSLSNFLTLKWSIKDNQSFFVSCCVIILFSFFSFILDREYNFNTLNYLFYFFLFFSIIFFLFLIHNSYKINKSINLEFIFFFLILFYFSKDRYYLDQDEFVYWGQSLKELLLGLKPYNQFSHHPKGTTLFQYLLVFFNYKEGLAIFANNILLISGYFYLFYERKLLTVEKIILFLIYYLLLNNLSFGFLSIYSDPVFAIFFSCILKLIYFFIIKKKNNKDLQYFISASVILPAFLLINRASIIYLLFLLLVFFIFLLFRSYKYTKNYFIIFIFFTILFLLYYFWEFFLLGNYEVQLIIKNITNFFEYQLFSKNFIQLFTSPIYFSHFGSLFNGVLTFLSPNDFFPQFHIPLFIYILLFGFILLFNFKYKIFFIFFSFFSIFFYSVIVFIVKFQIEKISILALQRYIGIFLLANYFFFISVINKNFEIVYRNYILIFFIVFLISVTPKKTIGLFVSNKIYYTNISNKNFRINRDKITDIKIEKSIKNIFLIHKDLMSDYTNNKIAGEHTFYQNIISYELFPRKILFIEYDDFLKDLNYYQSLKQDETFFIFFDLAENQLKKINYFQKFFIINTY